MGGVAVTVMAGMHAATLRGRGEVPRSGSCGEITLVKFQSPQPHLTDTGLCMKQELFIELVQHTVLIVCDFSAPWQPPWSNYFAS